MNSYYVHVSANLKFDPIEQISPDRGQSTILETRVFVMALSRRLPRIFEFIFHQQSSLYMNIHKNNVFDDNFGLPAKKAPPLIPIEKQ